MSPNGGPPRAVLTEGPIAKTLVKLAAPMVVAMIAMVGFNMVDTFFVGRLGTIELAAISFTFPVILVVNSLTVGMGVGASSAIAKAIGRGDEGTVRRLATDSLSLSGVIVAVISIVGLLTIDPLFTAMGADAQTLPLVREYMTIWYAGGLVVVVPMVGNSAIRATGDTQTPAKIMIIAMVVNIILDPLLIFGLGPVPALGLQGAAWATLAARAAALAASVWVLMKKHHMITFERPTASEGFASWRQIIHVGVPAGVTQVVVPVSMGFVTRLVSEYGVEEVAGFGVATRLEMLPLMLVGALASVMVPYVGQNWGAGQRERVSGGMKVAYIYAMAIGAITFVVSVLAARPIASVFDDDPTVVATVVSYLLIVSLSYGLQGVMQLSASGFNALARPMPALVLAVMRMAVLYIPLAYLGSVLWEVSGIFIGAAVANAITGVLAWVWFFKYFAKMEPHVAPAPSEA